MGKIGRVVGTIWAVLALVIGISANSSDSSKESTSTQPKKENVASAATKKEETKKEEIKKEQPKQVQPIQVQPKQEQPKKEQPKKEQPKTPKWNTKDMNIEDNGNVPIAVQLLKSAGDITQKAESPSPGDVAKAPWDFYGKVVKISGEVGIVQEYPPASDFAQVMGGSASEIIVVSEDGTITDFFKVGTSGSVKVGDTVQVYGYPAGLVDVDNKMGGKTTQLVIVGNILN